MTAIYALVEGHLDGCLLRVLLRQLGHANREVLLRDARGGGNFWSIAQRYNQAAKHRLVIGLADQENAPCAAALLSQLKGGRSSGFQLRLAVRMLESWLMADRDAFAAFIGVRAGLLPAEPDASPHPKRLIASLAAASRKRTIREQLSPAGSGAVVGPEYTPAMVGFIESQWDSRRARLLSPSLDRACTRWADL